MNTYRPAPASHYWLTALKVLILILGLYLSALVLGKVFSWLFLIIYSIIKVVVFIIVAFIVIHFFLKLLFQFNLFRFVFGSRFQR